ncbi:hypothetical protein NLG97_g3349 [Lecanicillium saksenae]|uniref:Uncharacterized protein n=1 Tax=Lecanicillium saksenae TaxID=468837 RepID=A0ACC1R043_9HYPO|nr:hypothetical protein NLG97_g3349 [Lecanicillium saksenae]
MPAPSKIAMGVAATVGTLVSAGPCDIYAAGGTPCVAAHSTTRALYDRYTGSLYQLKRGSDDQRRDIFPLTAGGVADAASQDKFCAGTTCLITVIYDQSGRSNDLTQAPPGGAAHGPEIDGYDYLASAVGAPVTLNGQKAYGVFSSPFTGYRNDRPNGTAINDESEGMYAVFDGTHFNTACCFDYGNAEIHNDDPGNAHMEAIYFGTGDGSGRGSGAGSGPWIMADLENGLFPSEDHIHNPNLPTMNSRFVTAVVKGEHNHWAIRGGNGQQGPLNTLFDGVRPDGPNGEYFKMKKEGAIILGIGGDNSNGAQGTFYEGVMTSGYPTDDTENKVQANIVAAKYAPANLNSGPGLQIGSSVSLRVTTPGYSDRYIVHDSDTVDTQVVNSNSDYGLKQRASFHVRQGLGNGGCYSFESVDSPGQFVRHSNYKLVLNQNDNSKIFHEDATFCSQAGLNGQGNSIRSWSYPTRYWRHFGGIGYIASNGGPHDFDNKGFFNDDVSFVVSTGFA